LSSKNIDNATYGGKRHEKTERREEGKKEGKGKVDAPAGGEKGRKKREGKPSSFNPILYCKGK